MNKMTKEIEALIKKASYYQETNEYENMFFSIKEGLLLDPFNYELYLQLGDYYLLHNQNPNQAYLCYENAEFYCHDAHDLAIIQSLRNSLTELYHPTVSPISIVIVSFNACDILKACIESIRSNNCPESYELIIVDNASTDGISEWLMQEKQNISNSEHFTIYLSKKNLGFGAGSNLGISLASPKNDIFFLNNDTIVSPNAIFWLRMTLYQHAKIGAVGSYSNYPGNDQSVSVVFPSINEYLNWSVSNNIPQQELGQERIWLSGFALLCKRSALDKIGYFDPAFNIGYYEDNDLCMRFLQKGFQLLACPNSFIYHYGSTSFKKFSDKTMKLLSKNREYFIKKWNGVDLNEICFPALNIINKIDEFERLDNPIIPSNNSFRILELECKAGVTLSKIKYLYPNALLYGIESNPMLSNISKVYHPCTFENIATAKKQLNGTPLDYIISDSILSRYSETKISDLSDVLSTIKSMVHPNSKLVFIADISYTPEILWNLFHSNGFCIQILNGIYFQKDITIEPTLTNYILVAKKND